MQLMNVGWSHNKGKEVPPFNRFARRSDSISYNPQQNVS